MQALEVTSRTSLSELAADAIAFALQLRKAPEPDPAVLRAEVKRLFSEIDAGGAAAGKDPALVQAVRYALCAFLDELVLSSSWNIRQDWASRPLQMEQLNDFTAGEEFYRRIDSLRGSDDPARREALVVYAQILGLGFRGKYGGMAGLEELRQLRARLHAELAGGKSGPQPLSLHWQVEEQLPQMVSRVPAWVFATIAAGGLLLLIVVLRLWLNWNESDFVGATDVLQKLIGVVTRPPVPLILGVVLAVVVLWFGGHMLQSVYDWPSTTVIVVACVTVVVLAVALVVLRSLRARQKARAIENEIRNQGRAQAVGMPPGSRDEYDALQKRFDEALASLQSSKLGKGALYAMPWFVVIGPPGSGKTTAITESGLNFPAVKGPNQKRGVRGVGGTRNCDWWFTDQAILLDTAGRYTTQAEDHEEWLTFLGMLKKARKMKPINGALVAISITDVLDADEEALERHAATIRQRIDELVKQLEVVFPVYLMLTKCDLLDGFVEFFQAMSKEERSQVWGMTFASSATDEVHERFAQEFDGLCQQAELERLRLLVADRPQQQQLKLFSLPLQLRAAKRKLAEFVRLLTQPNPYSDASELRGVYLTSGTQEGAPIDLVLKKLSAAFGVQTRVEAGPKTSMEQKSYFLRDLFTRVMQADKDLARSSAKVQRQREIVRKVVIWSSAAAALVGGAMAITTWWGARSVIAEFRDERVTALAIDRSRTGEPSRDQQEGLGRLRQRYEAMQQAYANTALLGPRRPVLEAAMRTYAAAIKSTFLEPIAAKVKQLLTEYSGGADIGSFARTNQLVLVYGAFDRGYVSREALRDALEQQSLWRWAPAQITVPADVVATSEASKHLDAYVAARTFAPEIWVVGIDKELLERAKQRLNSGTQLQSVVKKLIEENPLLRDATEEDLARATKERVERMSGPTTAIPDENLAAMASAERRLQVMQQMAAIGLADTTSLTKVVDSLSDLDSPESRALKTFTEILSSMRRAGAAPRGGNETAEVYAGALKDIASLRDDIAGLVRNRGEQGYLLTDVLANRMDWAKKFGLKWQEVRQKVDVKLKALEKQLAGDAAGQTERVVDPIGSSLQGMLDSVASALAREARAEMQSHWVQMVDVALKTATERFPCRAGVEAESTAAEFGDLFRPGGKLANQFVVIERLREIKELRSYLELADEFDSFRARVAAIQAACFDADGKGPRLQFRIAKMIHDSVTENVKLAIAQGNEVSKSSGSAAKIRNQLRRWDVGQAGAQLILETSVMSANNQKMVLTVPKERPAQSSWSFLRVLAAGTPERVNNDAKVTWSVPYPRNDGSSAETVCWLQFEPEGSENPLHPRFFELSPPTKIFRDGQ